MTRLVKLLRLRSQQLQHQNARLDQQVKERTQKLSESRLEIIHRLVYAAEYRDTETRFHIQRISYYTTLLAKAYGLHERACEIVRLASPMHDIGKIGIPDNILLKPGKLTQQEWEIIKTHTTIGAKILSDNQSPFLRAGQLIAASHHERWDGSGYPAGLQGQAIPLLGRITAIADVFDALTTKRPYKEAWTIEDAVETIHEGRGSQFDPQLVDLFVQNVAELVKIRARFPDDL